MTLQLNRESFRLRWLMLAVLSLVALGALSAQAAQGSEWEIETASGVKQLSEIGTSENVTIGLTEGQQAELGWTISATPVTTTCSSMSIVEGQLKTGGTGTGKLQLTNCVQKTPAGCAPPIKFISNVLKFSPVVASGKTYLVFQPISGTTIGTITYTGTCAIAGTPFKITGGFNAEMPTPESLLAVHGLSFVVSAGPAYLSVAGNPAYFKAPVTAKLSGANAGRPWGLS